MVKTFALSMILANLGFCFLVVASPPCSEGGLICSSDEADEIPGQDVVDLLQAKASVSQMGELRDEEASNIIRRESSEDGAQPFFVGSWSGHHNNWYGDVGIAFIPQIDLKIVALGRHYHDVTKITETVPVTLWSVETKTPLAIVNVGPRSFHEGHYVWEPVVAPGVVVSQGREYRLTQACTLGMRDKWFDETITYTEVQSNAATGFASFKGAVSRSGYGYPVNEDGQFRRAGMVNFKMARPPVHIIDEIEIGAIHSAGIHQVAITKSEKGVGVADVPTHTFVKVTDAIEQD